VIRCHSLTLIWQRLMRILSLMALERANNQKNFQAGLLSLTIFLDYQSDFPTASIAHQSS